MNGTPGNVQGAVLRIESAWVDGGRVTLRFAARAGAQYTVAYKADLSTPNWIFLAEVPPSSTPGSREYEEVVPQGVAQRYYRISSP